MAATAFFTEITLDPQLIGGAWKLYHYEPGTTTLRDVWTDRAKGATAAQPVVADANGVVSFYGDGLYDLVAYTTADVLKYTWEDVYIADASSVGSEGSALTSASTLVLSATASEIYNHVTGTVTIAALSGTQAFVILTFNSALTLTDGASFQLRNRESRQVRADETVLFVNDGSGVLREVTPPIRLANAQWLTGRNAAGTAEINIVRVTSGDVLEFGTAVALSIADNVFTITGSSDATKKAAFEVDGLTVSTTRTLTVQDKNGTIALTSEFDYATLAGSSGRLPFPATHIQGLTYANNAGDATNDLDIAAGQCRDATNAHNLILSALTKRSDATWVVGTSQGGLDTGAVGNSEYYIWAIKRSDTGVCDVLFSLSSTAPTMPTNYDYKRLIGWFKRVGATIVAFTTMEVEGGGLRYDWTSPSVDITLSNSLTTARQTAALKVPTSFVVLAHVDTVISDVGQLSARLCRTGETDAAPTSSGTPLTNIRQEATGQDGLKALDVLTSATGTVAMRAASGTVDSFLVATLGFTWARRV